MKNILLVTNLPFDEKITNGETGTFGGWVTQIAHELNGAGYNVGFVFRSGENPRNVSKGKINFYTLNYSLADFGFNEIIQDFNPDVIHCEGTEYKHNLYLVENFNDITLISLQGLISSIIPYFCRKLISTGFVKLYDLRSIMVFLLIKIDVLSRYKIRAANEKRILNKARHITGRTDWDCAHSRIYAPSSHYYGLLRFVKSDFVAASWDRANTEYDIFVPNAARPYKGFHILLQAIQLVKKTNPNVRVLVAGQSPEHLRSLKEKFSYLSLVQRYIKRNQLGNNIVFAGHCSAQQMKVNYCNAKCVVIPSTIENSPNALIEAQSVGVPVIVSYVGGVSSMSSHNIDSLTYRYDDYILLSHYINKLLSCKNTSLRLSEGGKLTISKNHDSKILLDQLIEIYRKVK